MAVPAHAAPGGAHVVKAGEVECCPRAPEPGLDLDARSGHDYLNIPLTLNGAQNLQINEIQDS